MIGLCTNRARVLVLQAPFGESLEYKNVNFFPI